jgi:subtilisin family serine protease
MLIHDAGSGGWGIGSGTSASTVYVTAAVALLLEAKPDIQREGENGGKSAVEQVKEWLSDSVLQKKDQNGHDDYYGYGLLQVPKLLTEAGVGQEDSHPDLYPSLPFTAPLSNDVEIQNQTGPKRRETDVAVSR